MSKPTTYITTPIYYVNDRPHIGHVYTTTVADCLARAARLEGRDVFFLTGTDEHAAKVVDAAEERGLSPIAWADQNATCFQETFERLGMSNNDFIRTSQTRHKERVTQYVQKLIDSGDVYLGNYEGWYDAGQEEYVPENKAKDCDYKSPVNGKPLVRKTEKNYYFRLSKYQDELLNLLEKGETVQGNRFCVEPSARCNETVARIKEGLLDVPISRSGTSGWGIPVPGSGEGTEAGEQTIYVWIDALFNYLSTVDTPEREAFWNQGQQEGNNIVHLTAKDILWFHAVIWPALLLALGKPLPRKLYAHSFWIAEGQKMSKSLGNFIDLEKIDHYVETFSLDALRFFLLAEGPLGTTDSDFAEQKFIDTYNSQLANGIGNCFSRLANMTAKYFEGQFPGEQAPVEACTATQQSVVELSEKARVAYTETHPESAIGHALEIISAVDKLIEVTEPFKLAKDESRLPEVATILSTGLEAIRIASLLLWPAIPAASEKIWQRTGLDYATALENQAGDLGAWCKWGAYSPTTAVEKGDALFMRWSPPKA